MQRFMTRPVMMLLGGIALGAISATAIPGLTAKLRTSFPWLAADAHTSSQHGHSGYHADEKPHVVLSDEQIARAGITIGEAGPRELHRLLRVPGRTVPSGDRI